MRNDQARQLLHRNAKAVPGLVCQKLHEPCVEGKLMTLKARTGARRCILSFLGLARGFSSPRCLNLFSLSDHPLRPHRGPKAGHTFDSGSVSLKLLAWTSHAVVCRKILLQTDGPQVLQLPEVFELETVVEAGVVLLAADLSSFVHSAFQRQVLVHCNFLHSGQQTSCAQGNSTSGMLCSSQLCRPQNI